MRTILTALVATLFAISTASAVPWRATPWTAAASSQARLIVPVEVKADPEGWVYGGIELRLPADAKTYWRTPGETGVPPTFDFTKSSGIEHAQPLYPFPTAFDDGAGGTAYGYHAGVVFPVRFKLISNAPQLSMTVDYGVCLKAMCVPAQVALASDIGGGIAEPDLAEAMTGALARVPVPAPVGSTSPRAIRSVSARIEGETLILGVEVPATGGSYDVFVEGEEPFSVKRIDAGSGPARFEARTQRGGSTPGKGWGKAVLTAGSAAIGGTEATLDLDSLLKR